MNFLIILGYSALYTITPESFPTEIRNVGSGFVNICARIAAITCPIVTSILLGLDHGFELAVFLYAALFILSASAGLMLKETRTVKIQNFLTSE